MLVLLTLRLLVLSWISAKRQLVHNRTVQRDTWIDSYDFIVVGGGTAGCVVANRLAKNPKMDVLLLEAGPAGDAIWTDITWYPPTVMANRPDFNWKYYAEPFANAGNQFPDGRNPVFMGRVIGGSSSHNGEVYNRGNKRDFDNWASMFGAVGWSYDEVMPYFLRYENNTDPQLMAKYPKYHATNGPVQISTQTFRPRIFRLFESAYYELGYTLTDINGPNQTGVDYLQVFRDGRGYRTTAGTAYVDPNPYPYNLHVISRALVLKILFNGTTAIGVEFNRNDRSYSVFTRKEVILSAGSFNSPQLLMLSGVGIKEHLKQFNIPVIMELPVGNNLMDHPIVAIPTQITDQAYHENPPELTLGQMGSFYFNNSGPLGVTSVISLLYSSLANPDSQYPNLWIGTWLFADGATISTFCSLFVVRSRGTVRLQSSSPYIAPKIDLNYYSNLKDLDDMIELLRMAFYILETRSSNITQLITLPSFENIGCPSCPGKNRYECTEGLLCYVRYNTVTAYHPSGTSRMGDIRRDDVVVDPQLKVKFIKKLRICDASVFPRIPNAHTTAATFMVGEKCAQLIKDDYYLN